jgi:cyclophilin family peptidyl-prolyl cis-trans isomerase
VAPAHVDQITAIARDGLYDNVAFHRVIDGFMAQTGDIEYGNMEKGFDMRRVGTGSSARGYVRAEFSDIPFERGTVGMARADHPDSASSQFFIMYDSADRLNGKYTVVGHVISGMEHIDAIRKGTRANNGVVPDPDRMIRVRVTGAE